MYKNAIPWLAFFWVMSTSLPAQNAVTYVWTEANGRNDGSSWLNAFTDLGRALQAARTGEVWVAKGTYFPFLNETYEVPAQGQLAVFRLRDGQTVMGGFAGWEDNPKQRNVSLHATILSGDLSQNDGRERFKPNLWESSSRSDNARSVLSISTHGIYVVDGFTITGANTFEPDYALKKGVGKLQTIGSGLAITGQGRNTQVNVTVRNCRFIQNASNFGNGGICIQAQNAAKAKVIISDCLFINCQSVVGGAVQSNTRKNGESRIDISNCSFLRNYAQYCGGAVSNIIEPQFKPAIGKITVRNCLFWGNNANGCRPDVDDYNAETVVYASDLQQLYGGVGNINLVPAFQDPFGPDNIAGTSDDDFTTYAFCPLGQPDSCQPPLLLNALLIHKNEVRYGQDLNQAKEVALTPDENSFAIAFALVGFSSRTDSLLEYRLEGYDKTWQIASQCDTVPYKNIAGGNYLFRFRVRGTEAEKQLAIKVFPHFWETGWFWFIIFLVLISLAAFSYGRYANFQLQLALATQKSERAINHLRQEVAQDVHDEIGSRLGKLSLTTGLASLMPNLSPDELRQKLQTVGAEARQIAIQLGDLIVAINPRYDAFSEVQAYLREIGHEQLGSTRLQIHFDLPSTTNSKFAKVSPEVKHQLALISREALNNVAKHAQATAVWFSLQLTDEGHYQLRIRDDGQGFDPKQTRRFGNGLDSLRHRAEKIGAEFTLETTLGQGTNLCVRGPL